MENSSTANFHNLIALFLAEIIRSRKTSLSRAAEISQRVLHMLPNMNSESQALTMLTEIEKDFEEISTLKQVLHFGVQESQMTIYEDDIKEFAAHIFVKNIDLSASFLKDAAKPGMTIQKLCLTHPEFCQYLLSHPEKMSILPPLR